MILIVNDRNSADELLEIVKTMSSPTAAELFEECARVCSLVETLFAVPPSAVVLILNVAVAVPLVQIVVVSLIVHA